MNLASPAEKTEWVRIHLRIPKPWHEFICRLARAKGEQTDALVYRECVLAGAPLVGAQWDDMLDKLRALVARIPGDGGNAGVGKPRPHEQSSRRRRIRR